MSCLGAKLNYAKLFTKHCLPVSAVNYSTKWSYFNQPGKDPLLGLTVGQLLDQSAELYGDNEAVVFCQSNTRKTYTQFKQDADKFAAGLIATGLKKGDRIGIWSPNYYEWILTQYASAKAGLILVNINPAYQTRELEYSLKKVGIRALISAETFKTQKYYEMLQSILPLLSTSSPGQIKDRLEGFTHLIMISDKNYAGSYKISDVMNAAESKHYKELEDLQSEIQFDSPANIQFTSGTTGNAKGTMLSHFNIVNNGYLVGEKMKYFDRIHRICLPVPLYHCLGCVVGSIAAVKYGACMVFPTPSFNATATAQALDKEKCTAVYGTPTMFIDILNLPDIDKYDFSSVTTGIISGAACPEVIFKKTGEILNAKNLAVCYGCTETSPVITQTSHEDSIETKSTTVGKVLQHTELKIVDPVTKQIVPCGQSGELWSRGYLVMLEYWNEPEKTAECITPDRWYRTGDLAVADEEGYIRIVGRIKDMIIRGGENIYPREIEEFLHTHPKIAQAHVVGVPDPRLGEELCVWINLKPGETLSEQEVRVYCKGQLSHFKIPRYMKFVDKFPTTISGKIQKFVIREKATKELNLK
uniref:Medium-chain acyl-CoA ligase ACSF2, mitochondrial n=1 Tax=Strigamia maritima TaxID=126957 RepID=T1INF2_STRMM